MIKAVVFDIGGVLEITPKTGWEGVWEKRLGLDAGELNVKLHPVWVAGSSGAMSEEEVERGVANILGLDNMETQQFMRDLWDEYCGTLNTKLAEYFASLRPRYKTAILSNSFAGARREEQQRYGFGDICDMIIYSHEEGIKKPDPRIYELTCRRLNLEPHEIVFLDDVDAAVAAANGCGIHGVLFRDNAQAIADIEELLARAESAQ